MSFDPEKVQREHMFASHALGYFDEAERDIVKAEDYDQLLSLLHDVSTEADPAGTLRELRLAQDTIKALELENEELKQSVEQLPGDVRTAVSDYNDELNKRRDLEAEVKRLKGEGHGRGEHGS